MKKIGLLILLVLLLTACVPNKNTVNIARAKRTIEAAHAIQRTVKTIQVVTQGVSEVSHWQSLILILLVLFLVVPFLFAACILIRCFTLGSVISGELVPSSGPKNPLPTGRNPMNQIFTSRYSSNSSGYFLNCPHKTRKNQEFMTCPSRQRIGGANLA